MRAMRKALALVLLLSGCILIEDLSKKEPVPVPVPVPFPGSGQGGDVGTDQLWLVRIERGTANLASAYESLISDMTFQLAASGAQVRTIAVASLYDGRILWAQGENLPTPPASLAETLRHYANLTTEAPRICTTVALASLGTYLSGAQVHYPDELYTGEEMPDPRLRTGRPFVAPPGAFLVGIIDHGERPIDPDASGCKAGGQDPASTFAAADPATWLRTSEGTGLPRARTRFAFIGTGEGISTEELRSKCLGQPNFPTAVLDSLAASPVPFFDLVSKGMNERASGLASRIDLCEAIGGTWAEKAKVFTDAWVETLKQEFEKQQ